MRRCTTALIVSIVGLSVPVAYAEDDSGAVRQMLERLAGHWTWTGQQVNIGAENSPYGQAGRFVGRGEGRLIMDGQCIIDEYQEKSPEGNILHGVSLISYDPLKNCFVSRDCMSDGSNSVAEFTIDGRIRKDRITITSKTGEILLARVVGEYSRDWKRLEVTWEASTDKGQSWKHWCTAVLEKAGEGTSDEQELIRLDQEWSRATNRRDIAALGRLLADDYVLTTSDGTFITKAQMLAEMQSDATAISSMMTDDVKVQVYPGLGLVRGRAAWTEPSGQRTQIRFTDTWLKRDGRWQCVATHESDMKQIVPDLSKLTPEYRKMQRLTGSWTYAGVVDPQWQGTPFGPAGKFSGKFTACFVLDGFFVLENAEETYESGGAMRAMTVFEYDAKTKTYPGHTFWSNGSTYETVYTLDEHRMTASMTQITKEGEKALVKAVWDYNSGLDAFKSVWELSVDEGKTWKHLATYDGKKQND